MVINRMMADEMERVKVSMTPNRNPNPKPHPSPSPSPSASPSPSPSPSPTQAIMTASGGIKKMLQGSWWLTVTQFCIEGLMVEGGTEPLPLALPLALYLPRSPHISPVSPP